MRLAGFQRWLGALVLCALSSLAAAEDIDIFAGNYNTSIPNLLIILDNTANWSATLGATTKFGAAKSALAAAVGSVVPSALNMGLMLFNETGGSALPGGNPTGSHDGAYVRYAIRLMTPANKTSLVSLINGLDTNGDKGASAKFAEAMEEARRYYASAAVLNGNLTKDKLDTGAENPGHNTYVSPASGLCQKLFIVFISNGPPDSNEDGTAKTMLTSLGGVLSSDPIPLTPSDAQSSWFDEYARTLFQKDVVANADGVQNVITYTISVRDPTSNSDNQQSKAAGRALVKSGALRGGGKYFDATDTASLTTALDTIIAEIQAVNSVFASVSLPVSINTQGTYLNEVYMGMFRPDASDSPRWLGNLKQYQILLDSSTGDLSLGDANGAQAVNPATGFITPVATSFWSTAHTVSGSTSVDFWTTLPSGVPVSATDAPDGEVVEKGGAAQQIRATYLTSQTARKVYSCPLAGCAAGALSGFTFDTANVTGTAYQTAFGAASASELTDIVNWTRGTDNKGDEAGPGSPVTVRPSVHGDVLHSRPVIVNYGGSLGSVVFYGANDGMLHAVQASTGTGSGKELWSFVAPEFVDKLKRLRDASPVVLVPGLPTGITPTPKHKDYFFDGGIGVYHSASQTIIYVSARRGGNIVYALDVTAPAAPQFLWKISAATTGFSELAQTWSTPKVAKVHATTHPVVIFGAGYCGGYDASNVALCEDASPPAAYPASGGGRGVYVVDGITGALLRFFQAGNNGANIAKSVAADVTMFDRDGDGYIDRVYAADTGGTVWRMDVNDASTANWKLYKFAQAMGGTQPEKFLFAPELVAAAGFDFVMIGSGDREHPLSTSSNDHFYTFKDFKTGNDATGMVAITDYSTMVNAANYDPTNPTALTASVLLNASNGWYYPLGTAGERVVNAPLMVGGVVYFATNTPTPNATQTAACSNLGDARAYALGFLSGSPARDIDGDGIYSSTEASVLMPGGGLPPSPVAGYVQINGQTVPFIIGSGGTGAATQTATPTPSGCVSAQSGSSIGVCQPSIKISPVRHKIYWYNKTDQ